MKYGYMTVLVALLGIGMSGCAARNYESDQDLAAQGTGRTDAGANPMIMDEDTAGANAGIDVGGSAGVGGAQGQAGVGASAGVEDGVTGGQEQVSGSVGIQGQSDTMAQGQGDTMASGTVQGGMDSSGTMAQQGQDTMARQIDLNLASVDELAQIPGIDRTLAEQIVAYRQRAGRFTAVDDLLKVQGMTPERLRSLRPYLKVEFNGTPSETP